MVYASQGFQHLKVLANQDPYPCGSNILGITCTFIEGYQSSTQYIDWDRVSILLGSSADGNEFHVVLPDILKTATAH